MTDKRVKIDQACAAGVDFAKLFYETVDKKRQLITNLYLDSATAVWNGNGYPGKENVAKLYESLPVSQSEIRSVDAQSIPDALKISLNLPNDYHDCHKSWWKSNNLKMLTHMFTWDNYSLLKIKLKRRSTEESTPVTPNIVCIYYMADEGDVLHGQTTILVCVAGTVKFTGKNSCMFSESFILTAQLGEKGNVWKIASDCFRFHEPVV